jgi:hypothetical protein
MNNNMRSYWILWGGGNFSSFIRINQFRILTRESFYMILS